MSLNESAGFDIKKFDGAIWFAAYATPDGVFEMQCHKKATGALARLRARLAKSQTIYQVNLGWTMDNAKHALASLLRALDRTEACRSPLSIEAVNARVRGRAGPFSLVIPLDAQHVRHHVCNVCVQASQVENLPDGHVRLEVQLPREKAEILVDDLLHRIGVSRVWFENDNLYWTA